MKKTQRGFDLFEFIDRYGAKCSLQKSSIAFEDCIWLGVDNAAPKILGPVGTGWLPYPIPKEVSLTTRMHLTQEQVKTLLPLLHKFAETGELS